MGFFGARQLVTVWFVKVLDTLFVCFNTFLWFGGAIIGEGLGTTPLYGKSGVAAPFPMV